jgi:hypothetical protein
LPPLLTDSPQLPVFIAAASPALPDSLISDCGMRIAE